jgi:DivIVA domain-containing protein
MIDLTPLDVRKKKGDFRRAMRGYDADSVDHFLDHVADRMEELVRENLALKERAAQLTESVGAFRERERAMNEALISAQQLREETRTQAEREAELTLREARSEAERTVQAARSESNRIFGEARRQLATVDEALRRIQSQRQTYLRGFRALLERHLEDVAQEEERLRDFAGADVELPPRAQEPHESPSWLAALDNHSQGSGE